VSVELLAASSWFTPAFVNRGSECQKAVVTQQAMAARALLRPVVVTLVIARCAGGIMAAQTLWVLDTKDVDAAGLDGHAASVQVRRVVAELEGRLAPLSVSTGPETERSKQ
jgi:hypothetical protein